MLLSTLLLASLLLSSNIFLVKQNTILEWVKKTQVKVLDKESDLPDDLVEALFMLLHNLLLVHQKLLFNILVGLPLHSRPQLKLLQHGL